jgi:hypothetical protein
MELHAKSVLVVGCVHADTGWLLNHVLPAAATSEVDAVFVAGDFGYWPHAPKFIRVAQRAKTTHGVDVWFIEGNHESYPKLARDVSKNADSDDPMSCVNLGGSLYYVPRGARLGVGNLSVVGFGGAVSIDRLFSYPGVSWFPEEAVTNEQIERITAHADVLVTHDTVAGYTIPGLMPIEEMAKEWVKVLPEAQAHRIVLSRVAERVQPSLLIHSHYHTGYDTDIDTAWGQMHITGLNRDGTTNFARVLSDVDGHPALGDWVQAPKTKTKPKPKNRDNV